MFVCVCFAVTDTEVQASILAGATTREGVTRDCRAGGDCGACHGTIEDMLEDACETACAQAARGGQGGPSLIEAGQLLRSPSERAA